MTVATAIVSPITPKNFLVRAVERLDAQSLSSRCQNADIESGFAGKPSRSRMTPKVASICGMSEKSPGHRVE
jgi:hypothetical protein